MRKFRKKPVVIEAEQWFCVGYTSLVPRAMVSTGAGDPEDMPPYHLSVGYYRHPDINGLDPCRYCGRIMHDHGWIDTLEEGHIVCPGDWIIKGITGELYPCKPDIFEQTYEEVL